MTAILVQTQKLLVPSLDLSQEHQHGVELVLSDLHDFFSKCLTRLSREPNPSEIVKGIARERQFDASTRRRHKALAASQKKVAFYIAAVQAVRRQSGRRIWLGFSAAVGQEIDRLRLEIEEERGAPEQDGPVEGSQTQTMANLSNVKPARCGPTDTGTAPTARIEEL